MARDEWAHLVLMTALDRVDDTALLRKYIIAELLVRYLSHLVTFSIVRRTYSLG